jgi:hypothetical protein
MEILDMLADHFATFGWVEWLTFCACLVLLVEVVLLAQAMTPQTRASVRVAMVGMAGGALYGVLAVDGPDSPPFIAAVSVAAAALVATELWDRSRRRASA